MNVLCYSTHLLWPSHFETELELVQRHLDAGDRVTLAVCDAALEACDMAPARAPAVCARCTAKRARGIARLQGEVRTVPVVELPPDRSAALAALRSEFADVKDLSAYEVDGFDVGAGVAASVISWLRDPQPEMGEHRAVVAAWVRSAMAVYWSAGQLLERGGVDRVYAFNGRFADARAVLRACQRRGVDCFLHERGHDISTYMLYENVLPHSIRNIDRLIRASWAGAAGRPDREGVGAAFFETRARGVERDWYSFTKAQQAERLPEGFDRHRVRVALYNSSEDEFAVVGDEWKHHVYRDQLDGVRRIARDLEGQDDVHVYLRMHPNSGSMRRGTLDAWYGLQSRALTVIGPDSPVSTYALLRASEKVLTFGSTVGIEAVYWGKPSILAGPSLYQHLGGAYFAESHDDVLRLLRADLPPRDREAALMYGFHMSTFGEPFRYWHATSFAHGTYRGVDLNRTPRPPWREWLSARARDVRGLARAAARRGG